MVIEELSGTAVRPVDSIHRSKITIPPATGIARPRLVEQIERGVDSKLTVISAPAGWGKSTLLASWAAHTGKSVAWVSLDEGDNNPTRYFRALVAALDHIYPLRFDDVFTMLRTPTPAINAQIDAAILSRLEEFPDGTVIVFDDFHVLGNRDQLRSFSRILEQMPPSMHIVVATRGDVQIPLARLRATGAVTVLRAEDIAFTVPEAGTVLAGIPGVPLDERDIEVLVRRTEGWIAGLRLAALSVSKQPDRHQAIERLRGTHRDIADYFREEILDCLDQPLREFLVETSVLDRFTGALCNAVGQRNDARALLDRVESADLFLVPLDDERVWYRFHSLFREVLRAEFDRLPGERQSAIHTRASLWFEQQGMITEAVSHALAQGDTGRAGDLVDRYGDTLMFVCGDTGTLVEWIEQLPDDVLASRAGVMRVYAWALTTIGRIDDASQVMERICSVPDIPGNARGGTDQAEREALLAAVHARIAAYRGDDRATMTHGQRALDLLDPIRHGRVVGDVWLSMGFAEGALGNANAAADRFAEAARLGRQHGNAQAARWGVRYQALTRVGQGRLREAEAIIDEDLERVRTGGADPVSTLSALFTAKAEILIHRNRLADAHSLLDQAIPLIQRGGDAKMLKNAYVALAWLYQAEGNPDAAREKVRRAEEVFPATLRGAHAAWLAMAQGRATEAQRWARASGFSVDDDANPARGEFEQLVFARIVALTEPSPETLALLDRLLADADAEGRIARVIELSIVHAVAASRSGQRDAARVSLSRALELAHREQFTRYFLDEGAELRGLLRDVLREGESLSDAVRAFAVELLGMGSGEPVTPPEPVHLDEPLTTRQMEILRLVAAGQSNREIARQLYIAEGTVKAHVHQVFGKLMARTRTEAVANARELRLLP